MEDISEEDWERLPKHAKLALLEAGQFQEFRAKLANESELGAVIVSCGVIDSLLSSILEFNFPQQNLSSSETDNIKRALQNFSTKVALCHALGHVAREEASTLRTLNKIRNKFAHRWDCSFEDVEIQKHCGKLPVKFLDRIEKSIAETASDQFGYTANKVILSLLPKLSAAVVGERAPNSSFIEFGVHREFVPKW